MRLPHTVTEAAAAQGVLRAGGTDLHELRRLGLAAGPIVDLRDVAGLDEVSQTAGGGLTIGARVTLAELAREPRITLGWGALAAAALAAAPPEIRARATIGGNLLQEVRCAYFRNPTFHCSKKGGGRCFAREGDAESMAGVEERPCIAPHPSTMAVALLAYGATARLSQGAPRDVLGLLGDGQDPRRTHAVAPGQVLVAVELPARVPGERGGYARVAGREHGAWPLVEAAVRVSLDGAGKIAGMGFAINGPSTRPQTWPDAARACVGLTPDDPRVDEVFRGLLPRFFPIRAAAYKAVLVPGVLREALDRAVHSSSAVQ